VSPVQSVYYFSDVVKFHFVGYSEGDYNLASIAASLRCDLSNQDYYYPDYTSDCYGIYKDKTRLYFSSYESLTDTSSVSVSVYGIAGGRGRVSVYAYGSEDETILALINDFVSKTTLDYFGTAYSVPVDYNGYSYEGSLRIDNLAINEEKLSTLNLSEYTMNKYYSSDNVYVTITEPYIQVYVPEDTLVSSSSTGSAEIAISSTSSDVMIRPYYWGRYFIITADKVYSEMTLAENNMSLAETKLKEFVDGYVSSNGWTLEMDVTGNYYYPILYNDVVRSAGVGAMESSGQATNGGAPSGSFSGTLADPLAINHADFSEFETEENKGLLQTLIDYITGLFA
jgi:hypothetical protein